MSHPLCPVLRSARMESRACCVLGKPSELHSPSPLCFETGSPSPGPPKRRDMLRECAALCCSQPSDLVSQCQPHPGAPPQPRTLIWLPWAMVGTLRPQTGASGCSQSKGARYPRPYLDQSWVPAPDKGWLVRLSYKTDWGRRGERWKSVPRS